jgi:integrase
MTALSNPRRTLEHAYEQEYRPLRLAGCSAHTDANYRINLRHFDAFLASVQGRRPGAARLEDLTDRNVIGAMQWLTSHGRSIATANKLRVHLSALWNFLARRKLVDVFPDVRPLPEPLRTPAAWTEEQLARLWKACARQTGTIAGIRAADFWTALHQLAWDSGERISALLGIEWRDIDLERGYGEFRAEIRKGRREPNLVRLHADTVAALSRLPRPLKKVFPWPYCDTMLWLRYGKILTDAGLPSSRADKFHRIRRSVASHIKRLGGNATEILKHSNAATTEAYLDPRITGRQYAVDLLFRPDAISGKGGA